MAIQLFLSWIFPRRLRVDGGDAQGGFLQNVQENADGVQGGEHGDVVFSGISGEITDHDQLLSAEKSGYVAFAPYASYLATDSSFSYWQSVQTAQGMDARIDSEDELCAFIAYAKEDLLAGEIVQLWMTTAIKDVARELRIALNSAGLNVNNFQFFSASFESGTSFNNSIYIIPSNLVQGAAA